MGLFDFLKKKKEEVITFNQVGEWLQNYLKGKELDTEIDAFRHDIKNKIDDTRELLKKLNNAALMNENIPERVKHIMEGNRKNYIHKINLFLDEIKMPENYLKIRDFSKELTEKMDKLTEETQKSYFVLKEFVEAELGDVAKSIKEMENIAIKFRTNIEKENLHTLEEIKQKLVDYNNSKSTLQILNEQKEEQEKQLAELKSKSKAIEIKISKLKNDKSYKEYEELNKTKQQTIKDVQNQKKIILAHFSTLEKALKKYSRISLNENLINSYLSDPSKALLEDEKLQITDLLSKMKDSLEQLGLKDKKAEKTIEEINKLSKELLTKMKNDLITLQEKEKNNRNKLLANTSSMNISEQESWLENMMVKVLDQQRIIQETEHKIERINPKLIKQQVRDMLKEFSVIMEK
ncbi:hypothetical protein ACFLTH_08525 [Bacteroidota bacterium]